ncbi:response regulator transcription factor [Marinomonas mediterranea]|jgi:Response regulators consisting of a CheY-like receiver domain and a winged-helix DNA-binding domain|uniref:Two component transcriptional regulator, winged helix family n=1 Tax=Marinomonas mediterranea (strain ATCC 700492 / JCM 21426 / NBRC 103028 / MMB-1) TaxID=717774 RepID=F2JY57_MARM1|nr:response regulator transcription factor [Marinomonas mediterranea]ADZ90793.1 two component transcriptional regulator, winged helix family [Marinomonas mediterranea MMB-1]WCN08835.1 response regulator [Marinomonas mediterranea]WCN12880.1 response regulator [Marinomonas mediterranea]WCN16948.1 response regulator [Marinomonas mediterranea MMB-1]
MKILVVEDHKDIAGVIYDFFELRDDVLDYASNGEQGLNLIRQNVYDVIILDIMLPKMDGLTVCRTLRSEGITTPVIMLTARDTREDILDGFKSQADDYLVKPFDLDILGARVDALIRRNKADSESNKTLTFGELTLDCGRRIVEREGGRYSLNPSQYKIIKLLISKAPDMVSRAEIIHELWGEEEQDPSILRTHIYQLRNLIDKPFDHPYIKTVSKSGYRLERPDERAD